MDRSSDHEEEGSDAATGDAVSQSENEEELIEVDVFETSSYYVGEEDMDSHFLHAMHVECVEAINNEKLGQKLDQEVKVHKVHL